MHLLCEAIDWKQSVEGSLKVLGKSLKTVLNEVHFIVNLYSFLPPVPQGKLFDHLPGRTTSKTLLLLDTSTITSACIFFSYLSHG